MRHILHGSRATAVHGRKSSWNGESEALIIRWILYRELTPPTHDWVLFFIYIYLAQHALHVSVQSVKLVFIAQVQTFPKDHFLLLLRR